MDSLDDEDVLGAQAELFPRRSFAQKKIEVGQLHLVPRQKSLEVGVEELQIQGIDVLEIVLALLVPGGVVPIDKVFVQRQGHGAESRELDLDPEPPGGGGFPRRRGPRHANQAHGLASDDVFGDEGETPGVECLGHHDDVHGFSFCHLFVEARHGAHAQDVEPFAVFPEDVHQPGSGLKIRQGKGGVEGGRAQHHARSVGNEVEEGHGSRGRRQGGVEKAEAIVAGIEFHGVLHGPLEQAGLVVVPLSGEDPPGFVQRDHGAADGNVLGYQFPHGVVDVGHLVGAGGAGGKFTVIGVADGVADGDLAPQGLAAGQHEEKAQGAAVDFHALEGGRVHQLHRGVLVDDPVQRAQITVHPPGHHFALVSDAQFPQDILPRQGDFGGNPSPRHHIHRKSHGLPRSFIPGTGVPGEVLGV